MEKQKVFFKSVTGIAVPVTLQSLLQSSFSVADQLMVGQLGSSSIAGLGLGGKFYSIFSVLVSAIAAAAGIMISQYLGQKEKRGVGRSFWLNLSVAALLFALACLIFPEQIMRIYTKDELTGQAGAAYLRILAFACIPVGISTICATLLRCMEAAMLPLYANLAAAVANTGLNYLLIFGALGFPKMGIKGAAAATVISQLLACGLTLVFCIRKCAQNDPGVLRRPEMGMGAMFKRQYLGILGPILVCEFLWTLGENVYAAIYGNIGTEDCAAMTLTQPIQGLTIGALSGLSQAAGILIGKSLGRGEYERAQRESRQLMLYGTYGSVLLAVILIVFGKFYVSIYPVTDYVQTLAMQVLTAFALVSPMKVLNMILGGGIIRSGGKTKYVMWIDLIGTWGFGVPLGLISAFVWKLSIPYVYFLLSLEEGVRLLISLMLFHTGRWMNRLEAGAEGNA